MRRRKPHHHVYVVELSKDVLNEPRFRKCNPGYVEGMPCVYVGMTGLDPDVRFDKHKAGIQANRFVTQYGLRLLPSTSVDQYAATLAKWFGVSNTELAGVLPNLSHFGGADYPTDLGFMAA